MRIETAPGPDARDLACKFQKLEQSVEICASIRVGLGGSVGCASDWWSGGCGFDPRRVGNILSWRYDHGIFSMVILSLPLIQEGQLSVSSERMCTILADRARHGPLGWLGRKTSTQTDHILYRSCRQTVGASKMIPRNTLNSLSGPELLPLVTPAASIRFSFLAALFHYENTPVQMYREFHWKFPDKNYYIFVFLLKT